MNPAFLQMYFSHLHPSQESMELLGTGTVHHIQSGTDLQVLINLIIEVEQPLIVSLGVKSVRHLETLET